MMWLGMIATGAIFISVVGLKSWDQVTTRYPTRALWAMAVWNDVADGGLDAESWHGIQEHL